MILSEQRFVVTGGDGFLGRAVCAELRRRGADESAILVPTIDKFDLTREGSVLRMYEEMKPTVVIHLAARVGGIGANQAHPGGFFYDNMCMGLHLVEHARQTGVKKFVQVGTICCYPEFTPVPFNENDLWNGYPTPVTAPYGVAKKALLVMLQSYRREYSFNGIFLMPVNLYGPGDNYDPRNSHVIPALVRKFVLARKNGEKTVTVWGTGEATREFLYVDDCARGLIDATENYDGPEPVNLGTGRETPIKEIVEMIRSVSGFKGEVVWDKTKPEGQPRRCLDVSRARELFGFTARMPLEDGLKRAVEWFEASGLSES